MFRQTSYKLTKYFFNIHKDHVIKSSNLNLLNSYKVNFVNPPLYFFCLKKQLENIKHDIFQKKQIEYEDVINSFTKQELSKLDHPEIVECIVVISQYTKIVNKQDLAHKGEIKAGINAFLESLNKNNKSIFDYFGTLASNYYLLYHTSIKNHIEPIWKSMAGEIDSLDINKFVELIYFYQFPFIREESKQEDSHKHLEETYDIICRNSQRLQDQLSNLDSNLDIYLCKLLKYAVKYQQKVNIPLENKLQQLIQKLTQKITQEVNKYSPQEVFIFSFKNNFFKLALIQIFQT